MADLRHLGKWSIPFPGHEARVPTGVDEPARGVPRWCYPSGEAGGVSSEIVIFDGALTPFEAVGCQPNRSLSSFSSFSSPRVLMLLPLRCRSEVSKDLEIVVLRHKLALLGHGGVGHDGSRWLCPSASFRRREPEWSEGEMEEGQGHCPDHWPGVAVATLLLRAGGWHFRHPHERLVTRRRPRGITPGDWPVMAEAPGTSGASAAHRGRAVWGSDAPPEQRGKPEDGAD
jgi:hypothetical protein